jgi:hypothetical protein
MRGLLWLLGVLALLAVLLFLALGDAWFRWFPAA